MSRAAFLFSLVASLVTTAAGAQKPTEKPPALSPASPQAKGNSPQAKAAPAVKKPPDAETELERAIEDAGNDRAALVRKLEEYLRRFPGAPRKVQVYRALVEALLQLREMARALDYAERIIALRPDDAAMMLFAVELLERSGDDASLTRAVGYTTRVIDRVEKADPKDKPARVSPAEWQAEQTNLVMSVYLIRGRLQMARHNYNAAVADLETSYRLLPNAATALRLGEIAELRKEQEKGIDHYVAAFVLPDQEGLAVNRWEVRKKLGNLWTLVHGSEAGLGERLLEAYDKLAAGPQSAAAEERNKEATDPFAFTLRRPDGSSVLKLSEWKGKILVLNFWATWCLPCRELEPAFEEVGRQFESEKDVLFLAVNGDEDETRVAPYLEREKVRATVVFSDGLDRLLDIKAYPTVLVLDRSGRIIFRAEGFSPDGFAQVLSAAIERALAPG